MRHGLDVAVEAVVKHQDFRHSSLSLVGRGSCTGFSGREGWLARRRNLDWAQISRKKWAFWRKFLCLMIRFLVRLLAGSATSHCGRRAGRGVRLHRGMLPRREGALGCAMSQQLSRQGGTCRLLPAHNLIRLLILSTG